MTEIEFVYWNVVKQVINLIWYRQVCGINVFDSCELSEYKIFLQILFHKQISLSHLSEKQDIYIWISNDIRYKVWCDIT